MNNVSAYFIAGTDTEIGKTLVTRALFHAFKCQGVSEQQLHVQKWVAAGAEGVEGHNEDALLLQGLYERPPPYELINPFVYRQPVSPHIAAVGSQQPLSVESIAAWYRKRLAAILAHSTQQQQIVLIEGAGGWLTPINEQETLADVVIALKLPVILVVGVRLGCLNHAMLTVARLEQSGVPLAGWVANVIDPDMLQLQANIEYLHAHIKAPFIGEVPYLVSQADFVLRDFKLSLKFNQ